MAITKHHIERLVIDALLALRSSNGELPSAEQISMHAQKIFGLSEQELSLEERRPMSELKPIADEILRIAEGYTSGRQIAIPALREAACRAYALYYFPINLEKIERLLRHTEIGNGEAPLRVLDYGSGPGTAAFALALIRERPFSLTAVDMNPSMRTLSEILLSTLKGAGKIDSLTVTSPEAVNSGSYDLIIAAHVFNELPPDEQRAQAKKLLSLLSPQGTLLIVESALKEQTRELMTLRDFLIKSDPSLVPYFPCTHANQCPMLHRSKEDWCHGNISWQPAHIVRQLDELTGFNKHRLKYSAFAFARNRGVTTHSGTNRFRVVTPPEKSKVGHTLTLCGEKFYGVSRCSKRVRDDNNLEFRRAEHFDLLTIDPFESADGTLTADQVVRRERAP